MLSVPPNCVKNLYHDIQQRCVQSFWKKLSKPCQYSSRDGGGDCYLCLCRLDLFFRPSGFPTQDLCFVGFNQLGYCIIQKQCHEKVIQDQKNDQPWTKCDHVPRKRYKKPYQGFPDPKEKLSDIIPAAVINDDLGYRHGTGICCQNDKEQVHFLYPGIVFLLQNILLFLQLFLIRFPHLLYFLIRPGINLF